MWIEALNITSCRSHLAAEARAKLGLAARERLVHDQAPDAAGAKPIMNIGIGICAWAAQRCAAQDCHNLPDLICVIIHFAHKLYTLIHTNIP